MSYFASTSDIFAGFGYTRGVWYLGLSVRHICFMAPTVGAFRRGEMTRNSRSIARNFNAAMEQIGRAIRPKYQTPRVYVPQVQKSCHAMEL